MKVVIENDRLRYGSFPDLSEIDNLNVTIETVGFKEKVTLEFTNVEELKDENERLVTMYHLGALVTMEQWNK